MKNIQIPDWKIIIKKIGQEGIVKNISFVIYVAILSIFYISISHYAENTESENIKITKELKELRWQYIDQKTQIMALTKESSLEKSANQLGLKITKVPPFKITINNISNNN